MKRKGLGDREITTYVRERERDIPKSDGQLSLEERKDLVKRSWSWGRSDFDGIESWTLNTRYLISLEFLPQICYIGFPEKIRLDDHNFRGRHLNFSREVARLLDVEEFLTVFDSAAESSVAYGDFPDQDFSFQKKWLLENLGQPKQSLEEMGVEREDCYHLEGYYWERVVAN